MKEDYQIGEQCWIYCGEMSNTGFPVLTKGRVVHAFMTPFRAIMQYVILLDNPDFIGMEVRDVYTMTHNPDIQPAWNERQPSAASLGILPPVDPDAANI